VSLGRSKSGRGFGAVPPSNLRLLPERLDVTPRVRPRRLERLLTDFGCEHSFGRKADPWRRTQQQRLKRGAHQKVIESLAGHLEPLGTPEEEALMRNGHRYLTNRTACLDYPELWNWGCRSAPAVAFRAVL